MDQTKENPHREKPSRGSGTSKGTGSNSAVAFLYCTLVSITEFSEGQPKPKLNTTQRGVTKIWQILILGSTPIAIFFIEGSHITVARLVQAIDHRARVSPIAILFVEGVDVRGDYARGHTYDCCAQHKCYN